MDGMVRAHRCELNTTSSPLSMHKDSHVISKFKPKIRIVHIFAPEIIKTDVENFRELVQRLTGKPSTEQKSCKKRARSMVNKQEARAVHCKPTTTIEAQLGFQSSWGCEETIKNEEHDAMWPTENPNGFYNGFGDLDGFIQGLSEFPLLPFNSATQSQMDVYGGTCLSQSL